MLLTKRSRVRSEAGWAEHVASALERCGTACWPADKVDLVVDESSSIVQELCELSLIHI